MCDTLWITPEIDTESIEELNWLAQQSPTLEYTPVLTEPATDDVSDSASSTDANYVDPLLRPSPQKPQYCESQNTSVQQLMNGVAVSRTLHSSDSSGIASQDTVLLDSTEERQVSGEATPHCSRKHCTKTGCTATSTLIMLPRNYDGESCWTAYKLHFLSVVHSNAWTEDEACSFLKARLTGDAALVLAQATQLEWTLQMLLGALDSRYGVAAPEYVIKARFRDLVQEENQTIDDYAGKSTCQRSCNGED